MIRGVLRAAHGLCKSYQDRLARRRSDNPGQQLKDILARIRALGVPPGPWLDIGGGDGRYRPLLLAAGGRPIEVDLCAGPQVDVMADVHHLPLRDGCAGFVLLAEVLEHLREPGTALAECYRVLRPGGILALTTVQYWHVHGHPHDYYRFTDMGLRYLCERAGLTVVDCWARGGATLVVFHAIECNMSERWKPLFVIPFYALADWLDRHTSTRRPSGQHYDALGWSLVARKP